MNAIRIGTSGWVYSHWKGRFYPADLRADDRLPYYVTRFDTVELNTTFYGTPRPKTLKHWRETAPKGFLFAMKASRYLTHLKRLQPDRASLRKFIRVAEALGDRLGPILFQLPPRFPCDEERLATFLDLLPSGFRYAFEFRDPSWYNDRVYALLRRRRIALCVSDLKGTTSPLVATARWVYVRLHGPAKQAYRGRYKASALHRWRDRIAAWRQEGRRVFVYFDNDEKAFAAADGLRLLKSLNSLEPAAS